MADCISTYSPNTHPILPSIKITPKFLVDISSSDPIFQPPNSPHISVHSSSQTKKTGQDVNRDNAVVPAKPAEPSLAAFTILTLSKNHFKMKKVLKQSDVDGSSRLLLPMNSVEKYILPRIDPSEAQRCRTCAGKKFPVLDVDDDSFHHLIMKKWKNSYFILNGNWIPNFVKRKNLEVGDLIGMAMFNGVIFFKLLKKKEN